jgi:MFS transporter, ACS family, hexuronate transporter
VSQPEPARVIADEAEADDVRVEPDGSSRGLGLLPFGTAACFALSATMLTSFPIIAPYVVSELDLSYTEAGAITAAYMFGYGFFQIPASLLGMRLGSGRVLLGATVLMGFSALIGVIIDSFGGWIVARLLLGIGGAAVLPLSLHLMAGALSGKRLITGIGIFVAGWGLGMTIALLGAAPLLYAFGWREVMLASAGLSLVVLVLLIRSLPRESGEAERAVMTLGLGNLLIDLIRNVRLNLMGVVNAAGTTTMVCVPSWLPLYLTGTFNAPPADISAALALVGLAVVFGGWSGGVLALRIGWRRVVIGSLLASTALVILIPVLPSVAPVIAVAVIIGWVAMLFPAPIQSLFPSVVPAERTALAAGYYNTLGFSGAFAASLVFGSLVDRSGSFTNGWLLLALVPLIGVAAGLAFPRAARSPVQTPAMG